MPLDDAHHALATDPLSDTPFMLLISVCSVFTMVSMLSFCVTAQCCKQKSKKTEMDEPYGIINAGETATADAFASTVSFRQPGGASSSHNNERFSQPTSAPPGSAQSQVIAQRSSAPVAQPSSSGRRGRALPQLPAAAPPPEVLTPAALYSSIQRGASKRRSPSPPYIEEPVNPTYESIDVESDSVSDPLYSKLESETQSGRKYDYPIFSTSRGRPNEEAVYQSASQIYAGGSEDPYSSITSQAGEGGTDRGYAQVKERLNSSIAGPSYIPPSYSSSIDHLYTKIQRGTASSAAAMMPSTSSAPPPLPDSNGSFHELDYKTDSSKTSREPSYRYITVRESVDVIRQRLGQQEEARRNAQNSGAGSIREHYYSSIGGGSDYGSVTGGAVYEPISETPTARANESSSSARANVRLEAPSLGTQSPQVRAGATGSSLDERELHSRFEEISPPRPPTSPIPNRLSCLLPRSDASRAGDDARHSVTDVIAVTAASGVSLPSTLNRASILHDEQHPSGSSSAIAAASRTAERRRQLRSNFFASSPGDQGAPSGFPTPPASSRPKSSDVEHNFPSSVTSRFDANIATRKPLTSESKSDASASDALTKAQLHRGKYASEADAVPKDASLPPSVTTAQREVFKGVDTRAPVKLSERISIEKEESVEIITDRSLDDKASGRSLFVKGDSKELSSSKDASTELNKSGASCKDSGAAGERNGRREVVDEMSFVSDVCVPFSKDALLDDTETLGSTSLRIGEGGRLDGERRPEGENLRRENNVCTGRVRSYANGPSTLPSQHRSADGFLSRPEAESSDDKRHAYNTWNGVSTARDASGEGKKPSEGASDEVDYERPTRWITEERETIETTETVSLDEHGNVEVGEAFVEKVVPIHRVPGTRFPPYIPVLNVKESYMSPPGPSSPHTLRDGLLFPVSAGERVVSVAVETSTRDSEMCEFGTNTLDRSMDSTGSQTDRSLMYGGGGRSSGRSGIPVLLDEARVRQFSEEARERRLHLGSVEREESDDVPEPVSTQRSLPSGRSRKSGGLRAELCQLTGRDYVSPVDLSTERSWPLIQPLGAGGENRRASSKTRMQPNADAIFHPTSLKEGD